ncbi:hypothetical protein DPMN_134918 [Dreissena polymorpha]|uniref:Uncharacterized protein n=1 Tax=Dreissena polymorpha TaxID=45954 RepID=A0A9D4G0Y7_DREPO|nr:hypothetical protein DPMN_134918 [Dreissena polymorpha]
MHSFVAYGLVLFAMFAYVAADKKRCFCRVALEGDKSIVKELHTEEHYHWFSVACSRLVKCPENCDKKVKEWLCDSKSECNNLTGGKKVVPSWQASVCDGGFGHNARTCGCDSDKCVKECETRTPVAELIKCVVGCFRPQ